MFANLILLQSTAVYNLCKLWQLIVTQIITWARKSGYWGCAETCAVRFSTLKAEHSLCVHSFWCNSAPAPTRITKKKHGVDTAIIFTFSMPALSVVFCFIIEHSALMVLVFYYKGMLEKVTIRKTQQFLQFLCYRKNPVKCSACAISKKKLPLNTE